MTISGSEAAEFGTSRGGPGPNKWPNLPLVERPQRGEAAGRDRGATGGRREEGRLLPPGSATGRCSYLAQAGPDKGPRNPATGIPSERPGPGQ